jgi:hypothetical protein
MEVGQSSSDSVAYAAPPIGSTVGTLLAGREYLFDYNYATLAEDNSSGIGIGDLRLTLTVPEPSSCMLAAIGVVMLLFSRRRL